MQVIGNRLDYRRKVGYNITDEKTQRNAPMQVDLSTLNKEQLAPVLDTEGPVLVTAGAGSGKTRLLTHRIAYLITEKNVKPYNILAITFTNKAAKEMRDRLIAMLGDLAEDIWVSTFHSMCVRILRRYISHLGGYTSSFSIYGEDEKEACIKRILKSSDVKEDSAKEVIAAISDAKNKGFSPDEYQKINSWRHGIDLICKTYAAYEAELKKDNALDYDDLLIKAYKLLRTDDEAREYYQNKFRYIHVDEFQDTNGVQYDIVKILAAKYRNVFVVGDEDQSIYGWRGANFKNIFDFREDFKPCKTYKLEQNYRSTGKILELANKIIGNNRERLEKKLWTNNQSGAKVVYYPARSDGDEADYVVRKMYELQKTEGYVLRDFAVLMRVNSLSRLFEERFIQYGISYRVYGGFKFYDRKEIKDLLAYLRIMVNHDDAEALLRIINVPKRGIGDGTISALSARAAETGSSLYDVIYNIDRDEALSAGMIKKVIPFANVLRCMDKAYNAGSTLYDLVGYVIKLIGLREYYSEPTEENEARKQNIREFAHSIEEFEKANPTASLEDYLQQIALYSDLDEDDGGNCVTIATIHSSKGLEFKVVFLVGLEDGTFPDSRKACESGEMEEERRLMYVAVTRARERLFLTMAKSRFRFGVRQPCAPSQFLAEGGFEEEKSGGNGRDGLYKSYGGGYDSYGGGYGSYRGRREYTSKGNEYNAEEVPAYEPAPVAPRRTQSAKKDISLYASGARIKHPKYGVGTVVSRDEKARTLQIKFDNTNVTLNFVLDYAPIELL